jgi:polysaccharide export outer membrane protein
VSQKRKPAPLSTAMCIAFALMSSACSNTPPIAPGNAIAAPINALGQAQYTATLPDTYAMRAGDVLSVSVFREPELSADRLVIGADGFVSLPLAGNVKAAGMTAGELDGVLTERLRAAQLKSPQVSVNIADYGSHRVTVEGAVKKAGVYQFQPGDRLSTAIALAEGTDRVANLREVAVFRRFDGQIGIAKFDLAQLRQGTMLDPIIQPGDRVVVGTSRLAQGWQDVLRALPAAGVFASIFR